MSTTTNLPGQTRIEIGEQITRLRFKAGREMPVTRRLTTDALTPYDERHAAIDAALSLLYPPTA